VKRVSKTSLGLLIAFVYALTLLSASGGRPVAPLDDAYIHFQYARQIAHGHPWQYNDGDPPSTSATSPFYPFLLAAGYLMGFSGERLVWFALGVGVVSLALSAWLVACITRYLVDASCGPRLALTCACALARWAPAGAALFFLLTGAVQWTYFSGMESGLFTVFLLAALNAFIRGRDPQTVFWMSLAALTRPEGLILAGVFWIVAAAQSLKLRGSNPQSRIPFYVLRCLSWLVLCLCSSTCFSPAPPSPRAPRPSRGWATSPFASATSSARSC